MNITFVFWLTACYTVVIFGLQVYEFLTGRAAFNFAAINAGYLGLLSAYVGGKEVNRWKRRTEETESSDLPEGPPSFRLPGESFVGLWVTSFLGASLSVQFWPEHFTYPTGLNMIALEVLTFYLGSSVSRWLKIRDDDTKETLEDALARPSADSAAESPSMARRISQKRRRFETKIWEAAHKKGSITRRDAEKLTGLKESAAGALLSAMVEANRLRRIGAAGSPEIRYEPVDKPPPPGS